MKDKDIIRQDNRENSDDLFIQEFFGSFDTIIRNSIKSILDLYQDKWSTRLILVSFYFLEEKANEVPIKKIVDFAYGTPESPGLVQKFLMENWSCFGGVKDEELVKFNKLITGSQHARNIPNILCEESLLMQQTGKNMYLTPLGLSVCQYLHFKFLKENDFNLKIISDFYKNSDQSYIISEIPESLPEKINRKDCINMGILTPLNNDQFSLDPKILCLYEFILDHPYIDFKASQILKREIIKTIHDNIIDKVRKSSENSPLIKGNLSSLKLIRHINWIYMLNLEFYDTEEQYQNWLSSLLSTREVENVKGYILQSEPGTGKTIWMLQQTCDCFLSNYKDNLSEELINVNLKLIPLFLSMKDFTIHEVNDRFEILYRDIRISEIEKDEFDNKYIRDFWSRLIGIVYKGRDLELWGKAFLRLFNTSNILIIGDGWDELTPKLKRILTDLILATIKIRNFNIFYLISTRYLERSIKPD